MAVIPATSSEHIYFDKCAVCGEPATKKCAGCFLAFYCGSQHQKVDWTKHKSRCRLYSVENVPGSGISLVALKPLIPGTILIREYPQLMFQEWSSTKLNDSLLKILAVSGALPEKCPGCETAWVFQDSTNNTNSLTSTFTCTKCALPLCSERCHKSAHSKLECSLLKSRGGSIISENKTTKVPQFSRRDLNIFRILLQEKKKGSPVSFKNPVWKHILTKSKQLLNSRELPPVSPALTLTAGSKFVAYLNSMLTHLSITLPSCKRNAVYERWSLLSHSCSPNCEWWIDDLGFYYKLHVRVLRTINPGEQITINRFSQIDPGFLLNPTNLRQQKIQCQCERCKDPLENGTCLSGVRCSICKDSLSCNYYFPSDPLDRRSPWICSGRTCKMIKTSEQILCITVKAQKELAEISQIGIVSEAEPVPSAEDLISGLLDFIVKHQGKILHPCHYLVLMARNRVNKIVSYFLGTSEKLFLAVVSNQPRAYDYCTYKLDFLQAYLAFLDQLYSGGEGTDRISGKILCELGFVEAAIAFHDFVHEYLAPSSFFRKLRSALDRLSKSEGTLDPFTDCVQLLEDMQKFKDTFRLMFGQEVLSFLYRTGSMKTVDESKCESIRKNVKEVVAHWGKLLEDIGFLKVYTQPEMEMEVSKEDLQTILMDVPEFK